MNPKGQTIRVAVPAPLRGHFDYLAPETGIALEPGMRVRVPFGRGDKVGVILAVDVQTNVAVHKLKPINELLDDKPVLDTALLMLTQWVSRYYQYPIGETIATALPALLRKGASAQPAVETVWRLTEAGRKLDPETLMRAPRQAALLRLLGDHDAGCTRQQLEQMSGHKLASTLRTLADKAWVEPFQQPLQQTHPQTSASPGPVLSAAQQQAVEKVSAGFCAYHCYLLEGVTGSGKTEVYLQLIKQTLAAGRQCLVLVPEIGLTPQLVQRFRQRLGIEPALLHSGLTEGERLQAWHQARSGEAGVVIGTRSAAFTPLAQPGLFIVDEEHDASLKQQDGLRYSARDVLVMRARNSGIPVLLGSATPSLESLHNARQGRYQLLDLPQRAGDAKPPHIALLDMRGQYMEDRLSTPMLTHMRRHLEKGGQVLLFLNRRGFAPTLICHECGWVAECQRCDAHMTLHQRRRQLHCHHCDAQRAIDKQCPTCGSTDLRTLGSGTERVEEALHEQFPEIEVLRIDRDSTRRKGQLQDLLSRAEKGKTGILLGTQMLAKGHHFPNVTLVGILDTDQGLFSNDFRAGERMAQLIVQVAGRAGRAERPGEVLIQTHHPDHPLLRLLIETGYPAFADAALGERQAARLPPFAALALLRAEATEEKAPRRFLEAAKELGRQFDTSQVEFWGPVPSPMERRAGRIRAQLLIQSTDRNRLQAFLSPWVTQLQGLKTARKVRWSLDVDPVDTY